VIVWTTAEAAAMVEVSEATIRQWNFRGYIKPVNPRKRPSRYRDSDVWRCKAERLQPDEHARLDALWERARRDIDALGEAACTLRV
jgi:predicted site-specific integrase-resolvase